jgi:hypothetical protein
VQARAEYVEYLRRYRSAENLSATISASHRVDERTDISTNLTVASDISLTDNGFTAAVLTEQTDPAPPVIIGNDIALLNRLVRRNSVAASSSVVFRPSQHDQLTLSTALNIQRYPTESGLTDYNFASQSASYVRRLNEAVSIGGMFEANVGEFRYIRFGNARTFSPRFLVSARLSSRLNLNASLGAAFTRVDTVSERVTSTTIAGSAAFCYRASLSSFCLNGVRQNLPSAIGRIRAQTSVGTSYSLRLSDRDTLQASASYATAKESIVSGDGDSESIGLSARIERRLNERLRLFAATAYNDTSGALLDRRTNILGRIGISYSFGNIG